jgi:hypothetical protein
VPERLSEVFYAKREGQYEGADQESDEQQGKRVPSDATSKKRE